MTTREVPALPPPTLAPTDTKPAQEPRLTRWRARRLRPATRVDLAHCAWLLGLAVLALGSGNLAARHLSPSGAQTASALLDQLELPAVLPDAPLRRDDGYETRLWALAQRPRTVVSFYAPWCGPCQDELPQLAHSLSADALIVVIGPDETPQEVRQKLDNLGFKDLRFYVDAKGQLAEGGRVNALPTTFLIGRMGRVRDRLVGYAGFGLQMLIMKTNNDDAFALPNVD